MKAGRGEISFDFYDFDLLVDVFNYAKERQTGEYSLAIKFGEKQFMIIDMELKNNQRCICVVIDEKHW